MTESLETRGQEAHESSDFVLTRTFDAPRDLVFAAWTQPEMLQHWWGPGGCDVEVRSLDLRPGGTFLYKMQMPDRPAMFGKWVFHEITAPTRIVFVNSFADAQGNIVRAPMSDSWPLETLATITFEEHEDKTTLTLLANPLDATEAEHATFRAARTGMQDGWTDTLDRLDAMLANQAQAFVGQDQI